MPLLAAVNGAALAGGFDVAVCCDVRIAATTARFAHPEFTFGDVVYSPLHDLVGGAVALSVGQGFLQLANAIRIRRLLRGGSHGFVGLVAAGHAQAGDGDHGNQTKAHQVRHTQPPLE